MYLFISLHKGIPVISSITSCIKEYPAPEYINLLPTFSVMCPKCVAFRENGFEYEFPRTISLVDGIDLDCGSIPR